MLVQVELYLLLLSGYMFVKKGFPTHREETALGVILILATLAVVFAALLQGFFNVRRLIRHRQRKKAASKESAETIEMHEIGKTVVYPCIPSMT